MTQAAALNNAREASATTLSLAHFTVIDAGPLELIAAAEAGGFDSIGLRIVQPPGAQPVAAIVDDMSLRHRFKEALASSGVRLLDVEAVWLQPETDVASLAPALDVAAELGARHVVVSGDDPDRSRLTASLAEFSVFANARGLRVMLEFLPYTHVANLAEAHALLRAADPANAGLLVDALHLSRSGGSPADIAAYDPALFNFIHLCDAEALPPPSGDLRDEARTGRLYPGEGALWLDDFVRAFPAGTPVAVEAPSRRHAGLHYLERAQMAGAASRALLSSIRHNP